MGIREIFGRAKAKNNNTVNKQAENSNATSRSGQAGTSSTSRRHYHANAKSADRLEIGRPLLQGHSYNAAVAATPPVTGSYPVAGNGPNILQEIQKTRTRRNSIQSIASRTSFSLSRNRSKYKSRAGKVETESPPTRAQTASNDAPKHERSTSDLGRTRSGFSMKSPPNFFSHKRKDSVRSNKSSKSASNVSIPAPPPIPPPMPIPRPRSKSASGSMQRKVRRYPSSQAIPEGFAHIFPSTRLSRKAHVDLFDAHSTIRHDRERSQNRTQALGTRNYGEDVADRNIIAHLGLNSPEFGYLKSLYLNGNGSNTSLARKQDVGIAVSGPTRREYSSSKITPKLSSSGLRPIVNYHHRLGSASTRQAPDSTLGQSTPGSPPTDDTLKKQYFQALTPAVAPAARAATLSRNSPAPSSSSAILGVSESPSIVRAIAAADSSGPLTSFPPRTDSVTSRSYSANRGYDDDGKLTMPSLPVRGRSRDQIVRSGSTLSRSSIEEESSTLVAFVDSIDPTPTFPSFYNKLFALNRTSSIYSQEQSFFLPRGEQLVARGTPSVESPTANTFAAPSPIVSPRRLRQTSSSTIVRSPYWYHRTSSMSSQGTVVGSHRRGNSSNGSASYSTYSSTASPPQSPREKRENYIIEGASEPPSLDGIVDLTNTVDTTVTTRQLPGTSSPPTPHSPWSPTSPPYTRSNRSSNRSNKPMPLPPVTHEKVIPTLREVLEEVITREIHTHDVFHRILPVIETVVLPTKHYVPTPDGKGLREVPEHLIPGRTSQHSPSQNWAIVQTGTGGRSNSLWSTAANGSHNSDKISSSTSHVVGGTSTLEPVLTSKKTYMTPEGYPRTEYVWRHPPVFETANGQIQYIFQGVERYLNGEQRHGHTRSESDTNNIPRSETFARKIGEGNLRSRFNRDSGYDGGYSHEEHAARGQHVGWEAREEEYRLDDGRVRSAGYEPVRGGEATNALRRIRERRSRASSAASSGGFVGEVERGMRGLSVNH
ncbi:hypothetical protein GLAREA_10908 [Glarea lozoyensis ATCC 20868]|uniref:Uncharacterized protein n=1 Tax=Glarea lozoyensis (strain ATCC 20868 / MF5171) TaxID=1116229 RepID=S3DTD8_GLAL2|nr:uncharacterized protein GLAREA_10908 [Glarea lozoyensis ATCC 20868]EPE35211.1 hypothetical protein GLAREA_10908 [Glarea lozoyensis ATCC 20868]